uniref:EGF-like domain-containing protein n=1 Tax=Meloidogyne incognita TaxID=6306 RepID=A0A914NMX6_MELIC
MTMICVRNKICSPSPNWFGKQCELRRCVQLYNPCENGAACEKTEQSFKCHCPPGFDGIYCDKQLETVCNNINLNICGEHGNCILGKNVNEYTCECHYGWTAFYTKKEINNE